MKPTFIIYVAKSSYKLEKADMFDILDKFRPSERDVIVKNVNSHHSVLYVSPWLDEIRFDLSLLVLIRDIKNQHLTIFDIQGGEIKTKKISGWSDLFETREMLRKITSAPIKYFFSDALILSLKNETFDIIIDRASHNQIIKEAVIRNLFTSENEAADRLIYEYNRVLRKQGKIIFLEEEGGELFYPKLINELQLWNYEIITGKLKKNFSLMVNGKKFKSAREPRYYIVGIKP